MEGLRIVLAVPATAVVHTAAVSIALAAIIMIALRRELDLPFLISLLLVPVLVATGYLLALALQVWFALTMLQVAGLLAGLLVLLVFTYEVVLLIATKPPPPTVRY